jgi:hypothetical protein
MDPTSGRQEREMKVGTMTVEKKIRKGGLVKLNALAVERVAKRVGYTNEEPSFLATSRFTAEDSEAWYQDRRRQLDEAIAKGEDTWHITMNDAGESRLPPTSTGVKIFPGRAYQVLRARCVGEWNYRRQPGQCLILDLETGREVYVSRHYIEAV